MTAALIMVVVAVGLLAATVRLGGDSGSAGGHHGDHHGCGGSSCAISYRGGGCGGGSN